MTRHSARNARLGLVLAITLSVLAGCSGAASSPSPQLTPPAGAVFLLRATQFQALPPDATFTLLPTAIITLDGRLLAGGAVPAIYPGPLMIPVNQRQLTGAGWSRIVGAARDAGLLTGNRDFTGGGLAPGSVAGRLQMVVDGRMFDLTGDPARQMVCVAAPCVAPPGTPEAFAGFWARLTDLGSLLGPDLGIESPYVPAGYAALVGQPPAEDPMLTQPAINWPLAGGLDAFGKPLADGSGRRCGTVTGDDAATLRPALQAANTLTPWRDPVDGTLHGLQVRLLLPGDGDPCGGMV